MDDLMNTINELEQQLDDAACERRELIDAYEAKVKEINELRNIINQIKNIAEIA